MYSVEEYLQLQDTSEEKYEYYEGEILNMSGGTLNHGLLSANMTTALVNALENTPCKVYNSDVRIEIAASTTFVYPDISVLCEPPEYTERRKDTYRNPLLIVEVLSESTAPYDRGEKFIKYRTIPSFCEYILISQDQVLVESFIRSKEGVWQIGAALRSLDDQLDLQSIQKNISLTEIYRKVDFDQ